MKLVIILGLLCSNAFAQMQTATIAFVGDVNFTGRIGEHIAISGTTWPFEKVKSILSKADYRVCNLESPAGSGGSKYCDKRVYFKANPKYLDALVDGGFNMVSLANNHALDYGPDILRQTREGLDQRGIKYIGIRDNNKTSYAPQVVSINGIKVAFFGYCNACPTEFGPRSSTAGVNIGMAKMIKDQVAALKGNVKDIDFIVAMPHWGTEYAGVDKNQEFTGRALMDAGVNIVIGAHPHVLQRYTEQPGFFIAYSLGNFLFPMRWRISLDSIILSLDLTKDGHEKKIFAKWSPVNLDSNRPEPIQPGTERYSRDMFIIRHGYEYPQDRRWPINTEWQKD